MNHYRHCAGHFHRGEKIKRFEVARLFTVRYD